MFPPLSDAVLLALIAAFPSSIAAAAALIVALRSGARIGKLEVERDTRRRNRRSGDRK